MARQQRDNRETTDGDELQGGGGLGSDDGGLRGGTRRQDYDGLGDDAGLREDG
jgi:hypothetical protein